MVKHATDFLEKVREFVEVQTRLEHTFREQACGGPTELPRVGTIHAQLEGISTLAPLQSDWNFTVHGSGVRFEHRCGVTVDIHNRRDRPDLFDAWRLGTYFRSLRGRGVRILNGLLVPRNRQGGWDAILDDLLCELKSEGKIESVDRWFRIVE